MIEFEYEEIVKGTQNFSSSKIIGKGSHGLVYKALLKHDKLVAIKKTLRSLQLQFHAENNSKLANEIRVLSSLAHNPNIIHFLGTSYDDSAKTQLLVMDFMPNGTLHHLLFHPESTPPAWPNRVEIVMQLARAVQFLHEQKPLVIHRDIKSENILFDSNWKPKLADFGLAVDSATQVSQPAGTIGYLDPCYTTPNKLSTKVDIYSFGVVLLEIITSRKAIDLNRSPISIVEWAIPLIKDQKMEKLISNSNCHDLLPDYLEGTIRKMVHFAGHCLSRSQETRPSMSEIIRGIENCCIERVRSSPVWISLIKSLILVRRRRRVAKQWKARCSNQKGEVKCGISSSGKLLLREVLADVLH